MKTPPRRPVNVGALIATPKRKRDKSPPPTGSSRKISSARRPAEQEVVEVTDDPDAAESDANHSCVFMNTILVYMLIISTGKIVMSCVDYVRRSSASKQAAPAPRKMARARGVLRLSRTRVRTSLHDLFKH